MNRLCGLAAVIATLLLGACGPTVNSAFSNCVKAAEKQALNSNKGRLPPELAKLYEKSARTIAEQQCDIIRSECRQDPASEMCRSLVEQYGK